MNECQFHKTEFSITMNDLYNDNSLYHSVVQQQTTCTRLPNGITIPFIGLGTTHSGGYCHDSVVYAIRNCGYRMIDTAKRYGVETNLAIAIEQSGVPRENIFLISKLWPVDFGYWSTVNACRESCQRLNSSYIDLYIIHFPQVPNWMEKSPRVVREESWRALEKLYDEGVCRAIGVSNYNEDDLIELLEYCSIKPHANQSEFHPYFNDTSLRDFCCNENILFTGYCPLAKGRILNSNIIKNIAVGHRRSPAQICLRWSIQNGVPAIPKSQNFDRLRQNTQVFDFALTKEEMDLLSNLHDSTTKCVRLNNLQEKFALPSGYKLTIS